jgi:hypothetical protein
MAPRSDIFAPFGGGFDHVSQTFAIGLRLASFGPIFVFTGVADSDPGCHIGLSNFVDPINPIISLYTRRRHLPNSHLR